jgi:RNA-directed DNA polymerase
MQAETSVPKELTMACQRGPIDFLGCHLRIVKYHFKGHTYLFRWPTTKSMQAVRSRVPELIGKRCRAGLKDVDDIIAELNPVLKGPGNHFKTGNVGGQSNKVGR